MKKRLGLLVIMFILVGGALWFYMDLKDKNEFAKVYIEFKDNVTVEYGEEVNSKDFIESYNGEGLEYGKLDTSSIGEKTTTYKIKYHNKVKEYNLAYKVIDTNKPIITLEKEKVIINVNEELQITKYIKEVSDVVDGKIKYKDAPKEDDVNYYTYTSNLNTKKAGTYTIDIKAVDQHKNVSTAMLTVIVNEEIQNTTTSSYNPDFVIHKKKIVVINAGHQAKGDSTKEAVGPNSSELKAKVTTGATGKYSKVKESQINLDVALKLRDELKARGYTVYMIRTTQNVKISNQQRALIANGYKPSVVISLHCDSADSSSIKGAHTIAIKKDNPYCSPLYSASSKLAKSVINAYCKETGIKSRGVSYKNDLTGLNWSTVPSVYLEMGFLSNQEEDLSLANSDFQYKCAKGIANGIDQYLK